MGEDDVTSFEVCLTGSHIKEVNLTLNMMKFSSKHAFLFVLGCCLVVGHRD